MKQIPNIEETHNTRDKLDEIVLDFNQMFYYEHQQRGLTRLRDDVVGWLRTTLHHQLQKAREEERERCVAVVRAEMIKYPDSERIVEDPYNFALLCVERKLKEDHSELDQPIS